MSPEGKIPLIKSQELPSSSLPGALPRNYIMLESSRRLERKKKKSKPLERLLRMVWHVAPTVKPDF